jgi:hypothetical protein
MSSSLCHGEVQTGECRLFSALRGSGYISGCDNPMPSDTRDIINGLG